MNTRVPFPPPVRRPVHRREDRLSGPVVGSNCEEPCDGRYPGLAPQSNSGKPARSGVSPDTRCVYDSTILSYREHIERSDLRASSWSVETVLLVAWWLDRSRPPPRRRPPDSSQTSQSSSSSQSGQPTSRQAAIEQEQAAKVRTCTPMSPARASGSFGALTRCWRAAACGGTPSSRAPTRAEASRLVSATPLT